MVMRTGRRGRFAFGDQLQRLVEAVDNVIAVENHQMRDDRTSRYQMVRRVGPLTMRAPSDYYVFERPYCTVSHALDVPFYSTHEALAGGEATRLSFRWEVEPQNLTARAMLTVVLPLVRRQLQQDVEDLTRTAAPQGARPQEEGRLRQQVAASYGAALCDSRGCRGLRRTQRCWTGSPSVLHQLSLQADLLHTRKSFGNRAVALGSLSLL